MTRYGAPEAVLFCKRCTMSNQRPSSVVEWQSDGTRKPTLGFNADGVCAACEYQAIMNERIDWDERDRELRELCDATRSKYGSYDCVVPGSGGKDSTFAAHVLRERYGMHPLLVTWAPHMPTDAGRRNLERWTDIGDHMLISPRRSIHRKLTQLAFLNLCHPFQPFIAGQRVIGPRIAAQLGIDLVFYGENPAQYAGPVSANFDPIMDRGFYFAMEPNVSLAGMSAPELRKHGIDAGDLDIYRPLDADDRNAFTTEVRYLGYYLKWDPQEVYYHATQHCGFEPNDERTEGSYSKYSSFDDKIDPLHYFTTLAKFGMGRATYDSSQEIRHGKITRDEGIALVRRFDHEVPRRYLAECLEYMGISEDVFWDTIDAARPEHLWQRDEYGEWRLKHAVWEAANA